MNLKLISLILIVSVSAFSAPSLFAYQEATCLTEPEIQAMRSKELKNLFEADINDRKDWEKLSPEELEIVDRHDLERRVRVGEIFAEGCFKIAEDYADAALIYQHGDIPDHYFQAFIWSNRAVMLGDNSQKYMMALAIDRYLVSIGKKQLFGSQAFASDDTNWCYCMQSVEATFPDTMRQQYLDKSLSDEYAQILALNEGKDNCQDLVCSQSLEPSLKGSVPGFW